MFWSGGRNLAPVYTESPSMYDYKVILDTAFKLLRISFMYSRNRRKWRKYWNICLNFTLKTYAKLRPYQESQSIVYLCFIPHCHIGVDYAAVCILSHHFVSVKKIYCLEVKWLTLVFIKRLFLNTWHYANKQQCLSWYCCWSVYIAPR